MSLEVGTAVPESRSETLIFLSISTLPASASSSATLYGTAFGALTVPSTVDLYSRQPCCRRSSSFFGVLGPQDIYNFCAKNLEIIL